MRGWCLLIELALAVEGFGQPTQWEQTNRAADSLIANGQYSAAAERLNEALRGAETLAPNDFELAMTYNRLGLLLTNLGQFREADRDFQRAVQIYERIGEKSKAYAEVIYNLANLYAQWRRYGQARKLAERLLDILSGTIPEDHPDFLEAMRLWGDLERAGGRYREAEALQRQTLAIWNRHPETNGTYIAMALGSLAATLVGLKRYDEAKNLIEEALCLAEKDAGPQHPLTGVLLQSLGELYVLQRHHAEAAKVLARSLAINERALGPGHETLARANLVYAQVLRKLNRKSEAKEYERRAYAIQASLRPEDAGRYTVEAQTLIAPNER